MKRFTVTFLISILLLFLFIPPGFAGSVRKNIEVTYDNILLIIDGARVIPRDVNGDIVEPFIYNGATYLPVRAVSEALGKTVEWDAATQTVYISEKKNLNIQIQAPIQMPQTKTQTEPAKTADDISATPHDIIVYVSNASDTIHLVSNCSGMKNYRIMTLAEAREISSSYCNKCAGHLTDIK